MPSYGKVLSKKQAYIGSISAYESTIDVARGVKHGVHMSEYPAIAVPNYTLAIRQAGGDVTDDLVLAVSDVLDIQHFEHLGSI